MNKPGKKIERLQKENGELKAKLAECDDLLAAIKKGAVDAFVTNNKKVFTLKNADRAYRILVEKMHEGAATLTYDGTILYCNGRLARMLGEPLEKVIGSSIMEVLGHREPAKLKAILRQCKYKAVQSEFRLKRRGKAQPLSVLFTCNTLPLNGGGLGVIVADLTRIKKTEQELERHRKHLEELVRERTAQLAESEKKFRLAFENAQDAIIWADTRTGILVDCNAAAERLFARPKSRIVGQHHTMLHPPGSLQQAADFFRKQISGAQDPVEVPIITSRGEIKTASIASSVIEIAGAGIIQGVFRDMTERKKAEEALINAARIKSDFTSMVSHELRTPLTALKESISQVVEGVLGEVNEKQLKVLQVSKRNVDRLARLIENVLAFEALESGRVAFKIEGNDINELIREAADTMEIVAQEKDLNIKLDLYADLPKIRFDRDKIYQVLSNLLNNSLKFTQNGGIVISTARMGNMVHIEVKDTGPGMKKEDLPRLFQKYEQLKRSTGGTGLGLAISREIIHAHGGKMWVESVYGRGTTVHFTLPIHERRAGTDPEIHVSSLNRSP